MANLADVLQPNSDEVAAELMDGEAVMINLSNGMYYSTAGVGGLVWQHIENGVPIAAICEQVSRHYGMDADVVEHDVLHFADRLIAEGLVTVGDAAGAATAAADLPPAGTYTAPELNVYRDMGDLLALDPPMPGLKDIPWKES